MSSKNNHGVHPPMPRSWAPFIAYLALILSVDTVTAFVPGSTFLGHPKYCARPVSRVSPENVLRPAQSLMANANGNDRSEGGVTSMPPRKSKHRVRKKKSKRRSKKFSESVKAMDEKDVAHHVASMYVTGPGGVMREKKRKAKRLEDQTSVLYGQVDGTHKQQLDYLKKLDRHPALVLNADYQPMSYLPLSMWNWQEAVKGVFSGKVTVVDVYPEVNIRAANLEIPLPSVIALNEYVPQFNQRPAFTRRNVFLRDEYKCQYCKDPFHTRDLSLDHVIPRSKGGKLNWENAVTSCRSCNGRKGSLHLDELRSVGMKLSRKPFVPTKFQLAKVAGRMLPKRVHPTWSPYLEFCREPGTGDGTTSRKEKTEKEGELFFDGV